MTSSNLPNLRTTSDQLRADNDAVGAQSDKFLVGSNPAPKAEDTADRPEDASADSSVAKADVFPFMRAYGCLGRKSDPQK